MGPIQAAASIMRQTAKTDYPKRENLGFGQPGSMPGLVLAMVLLLSGCAALPPQPERPPAHAFGDPEVTTLGRHALAAAEGHAGQTGLVILDRGYPAFLQRAALIEAAERSIDAQYYIWNSDRSGRYLAQRLLLAADRGVQVRVLLDDINVGARDGVIAALDRHPNIEIRIFNPSAVRTGIGKWLAFATEFQRLNRRMHNKTFVVDGAVGIVGGRNIGDEYFDLHPELNFRDRDVLAVGPVVREISVNFDAYWNSASTYPIAVLSAADWDQHEQESRLAAARAAAADTTGLRPPPVQHAVAAQAVLQDALGQAVWAQAELVFDPPAQDLAGDADQPQRTAQALHRFVAQARVELLIESAYLVLGDVQLDMLRQLRARGVRVAALTNSLASNDVTANHASYARRRPAMLASGLELHELRPDAAACKAWVANAGRCDTGVIGLHTKSAVFDRKTLYIGSFNVNLRSIYLNGETVLVIHSPELAERMAQDMVAVMTPDNSWRVSADPDGQVRWFGADGESWTHEPDTGWWRRVKSALLSRLPLEKYF